jgi:hypothetical protein
MTCAAAATTLAGGAKSDRASVDAAITIIPPQTEQRALTAADGILAGSTRNTERHSGQVTFICDPRRAPRAWVPRCA